ncbi:MAG: RuBisCO accumulation factor 1 [Cyanobacteria bacterium J06632_19]
MTDLPPNSQSTDNQPNQELAEELLRKLRQKEGNWVEWGQDCAYLQKSGYNPQDIFEATGFEPIQQNQIIVGSQVYTSLEKGGASEEVKSHYLQRGSDVLYEFRMLAQEERASAAELAFKHKVDADEVKEVARAIKDFSRLRNLPEGFSAHPGDAVAYQTWKQARQKSDLQLRSRFIAKGLKFAHTDGARQKIEQLLTDFTVVPQRPAPLLPFYRLESEAEMSRVVPVAGELPLTPDALKAVPMVEEEEPFNMVKFEGAGAWVPLPGWQVVLIAEDPVVILGKSDIFPNQEQNTPKPVMIAIDRSQRKWDNGSYFVVDNSGELDFQWFETEPDVELLGRVIVIVKPKRIFDDEIIKDSWQIDE